MESTFQPPAGQQPPVPPGYAPPYASDEVVSVKSWLGSLVILMIPIVNIIFLFVWAFGDSANLNRKYFARAYLLWALIGIVLYIILLAVFGAVMFSAFKSMNDMNV
ncbi:MULTISPECIES: hypothetical protein [Paenibacillus]|uniref:hypothetical protein n=1 Tax=Paenibacillus TaxID=44249 RepID=UPI00039025FE|nr:MULTISPECIES: hypothetical protein [Paenibacillus]CDN41147.1 hypothetical protein BN871_AC_00410 [Paenibacillus sp. P22]